MPRKILPSLLLIALPSAIPFAPGQLAYILEQEKHIVAKFEGMDFEEFHFYTMTAEECRITFSVGNGNPYLNKDGFCRKLNRKCYRDSQKNNGYFITKETQSEKSCVIDTAGIWKRGKMLI